MGVADQRVKADQFRSAKGRHVRGAERRVRGPTPRPSVWASRCGARAPRIRGAGRRAGGRRGAPAACATISIVGGPSRLSTKTAGGGSGCAGRGPNCDHWPIQTAWGGGRRAADSTKDSGVRHQCRRPMRCVATASRALPKPWAGADDAPCTPSPSDYELLLLEGVDVETVATSPVASTRACARPMP